MTDTDHPETREDLRRRRATGRQNAAMMLANAIEASLETSKKTMTELNNGRTSIADCLLELTDSEILVLENWVKAEKIIRDISQDDVPF